MAGARMVGVNIALRATVFSAMFLTICVSMQTCGAAQPGGARLQGIAADGARRVDGIA
jgi:hypothetical protein